MLWIFIVLLSLSHLALAGIFPSSWDKHSADLKTLRMVQVTFRHGDRTPFANVFPNDPYGDSSYWPEGYGQLTKEGTMMQYQLGQYLRLRYAGFLNKTYNREEIYARSSDLDRTIMSAQANLAGLYPPEGNLWNNKLLWQPIPVHTIPMSQDNKINFARSCPKYKLLLQELLDSEHMKELNDHHKELYEYLTKHSGRNVLEFNAVAEIFDSLVVQERHGLKLPKWTNEVYPDKMFELAVLPFELISGSDELSKLRGGPLLTDFILNMDVALNNTLLTGPELLNFRKAKLYMNSGHDTTLTTLMTALGVYDNKHIPGYASMLMVELHQESSGTPPFVKVLYRNDTSDAPKEMQVPGCPIIPRRCNYRKFRSLLEDKMLAGVDWENECAIQVSYFDIPNKIIHAMKNASDKEKLLKKLKSVWRELFDGYLKYFAFWARNQA